MTSSYVQDQLHRGRLITLSWIVSAHHSNALSVLNGLIPRKNSYKMQPRLNQSTHSLYGTRLPAEFRRRISGAQSVEKTGRRVWRGHSFRYAETIDLSAELFAPRCLNSIWQADWFYRTIRCDSSGGRTIVPFENIDVRRTGYLTSSGATSARQMRSNLTGQPHIRNPRTTILVQHHVLWLEISINDALLVEMLDTQHRPRRVVLRHHLRKNTKVLQVKPQITCDQARH